MWNYFCSWQDNFHYLKRHNKKLLSSDTFCLSLVNIHSWLVFMNPTEYTVISWSYEQPSEDSLIPWIARSRGVKWLYLCAFIFSIRQQALLLKCDKKIHRCSVCLFFVFPHILKSSLERHLHKTISQRMVNNDWK